MSLFVHPSVCLTWASNFKKKQKQNKFGVICKTELTGLPIFSSKRQRSGSALCLGLHSTARCTAVYSGCYLYTWWAQLAPCDKQRGSFVKVVDQNLPPIFTRQTTPLAKLSPIFTFPLFFDLRA